MLHDSNLLKSLWAGAFATATYMYNHTRTKALGGCTPYLAHCGTPDVSDLHTSSTSCTTVELAAKLVQDVHFCIVLYYSPSLQFKLAWLCFLFSRPSFYHLWVLYAPYGTIAVYSNIQT